MAAGVHNKKGLFKSKQNREQRTRPEVARDNLLPRTSLPVAFFFQQGSTSYVSKASHNSATSWRPKIPTMNHWKAFQSHNQNTSLSILRDDTESETGTVVWKAGGNTLLALGHSKRRAGMAHGMKSLQQDYSPSWGAVSLQRSSCSHWAWQQTYIPTSPSWGQHRQSHLLSANPAAYCPKADYSCATRCMLRAGWSQCAQDHPSGDATWQLGNWLLKIRLLNGRTMSLALCFIWSLKGSHWNGVVLFTGESHFLDLPIFPTHSLLLRWILNNYMHLYFYLTMHLEGNPSPWIHLPWTAKGQNNYFSL